MIGWDTVLCAAAALCVSGRHALLLLITLSLTQLFGYVVSLLWNWWELSHQKEASIVTAVAFGGALWRCFSAGSAQNADDLGRLLPLLVLFVLCGYAADTLPSWKRFFKSAVLVLAVGCVRELLAEASIFDLPLGYTAVGTVFGRSADGSLGVGGVLVAAVCVWLFGLSSPVGIAPLTCKRTALFTAVFTAGAGCVLGLFPTLSVTWRFFGVFTLAVFCCIGISVWRSPWLPLVAATAVCLPTTLTPLTALAIGCATALIVLAAPPLINRLARAPLPRRFSGPPLYLTLAAVTLAVWSAL